MAKKYLEHIKDYTFNVITKTITFTPNVPSLALTDIKSIVGLNNLNEPTTIFKNGLTGLGGTIALNVLTLNTNLTGFTNTSTLSIEVEHPLLLNSLLVDEDNKVFYENQNTYSNKNRGLLNIFETTPFYIAHDGLYEFKIIVNGTNEKKKKAFEVYNYLDNDPTKQIMKIVGYAAKDNEFHTESRDNILRVTKGTHSVFVKLETNDEGKSAIINDYKLIIKAL